MCVPTNTESSSSTNPDTGVRTMLGLGGLMMLACIAGPALLGAIGGLGAGVLLGGGTVAALALRAGVPAAAFLARRRAARRQPAPD